MRIGTQEVDSIIVTTKEGEVVAVVSDEEIVEIEGFEVIIEPTRRD